MYGKLFASMYDGTLYGQWQAIITLQQMVILADSDGVVDITPPALAAKTSIPLEIIEKGLEQLSEPDRYSRSSAEEGRRIVPIEDDRPWGWVIVNYSHYKNLASVQDKKEKDRQRMAEKRSKNNNVADSRGESKRVENVAHIDIDVDVSKNHRSSADASDRFKDFWDAYPKKVKKAESLKVWKSKRLNGKADEIIADVNLRKRSDRRWLDGFRPDPTTYLRGERWNDEIEGGQQRQDDPGEWGLE